MKAVRTSWQVRQRKQLVTGLGHKTQNTQNKQLLQSFSAYMYVSDWWLQWQHNPANMHQTSLTELSMLVSDWWTILCHTTPHSTHKAQHIHTSHTRITLLYPTNTFKNVYLSIKNQGGVTPIDSIVTAATAGQNFDRLFRQFDRWPH